MAERHSGYTKLPDDHYCTPAWVTEALLRNVYIPPPVWEPAYGEGHMFDALNKHCESCYTKESFLSKRSMAPCGVTKISRSIVTNPPYSRNMAVKFVRHALELTRPMNGMVCMLLPFSWDSAKGRQDIFDEHPAFKCKLTLLDRIRWANLEQKSATPSKNHAWYVWDWGLASKIGHLPYMRWITRSPDASARSATNAG